MISAGLTPNEFTPQYNDHCRTRECLLYKIVHYIEVVQLGVWFNCTVIIIVCLFVCLFRTLRKKLMTTSQQRTKSTLTGRGSPLVTPGSRRKWMCPLKCPSRWRLNPPHSIWGVSRVLWMPVSLVPPLEGAWVRPSWGRLPSVTTL